MFNRKHISLTESESKLMDDLKNQHRCYFEALMYSAGVIIDRNEKYTGKETDRDVFANFVLDARIQGVAVSQVFKQWISKKTARIMINDGNYLDESFQDSLRDLANYALLWIGFLDTVERWEVDLGIEKSIQDFSSKNPNDEHQLTVSERL